jgi:hypothetical protein
LACPDTRPCPTLPPERRTREATLHVHRQRLTAAEFDSLGPIPVTRVARTCIDVTRESGLRAGLVTVDAALRLGLLTSDELRAAYAELRRCGDAPDSPMATRSSGSRMG